MRCIAGAKGDPDVEEISDDSEEFVSDDSPAGADDNPDDSDGHDEALEGIINLDDQIDPLACINSSAITILDAKQLETLELTFKNKMELLIQEKTMRKERELEEARRLQEQMKCMICWSARHTRTPIC